MYIEMPRGDYRPFCFLLKNKDGTELNLDVDEIYITFKKDTFNLSKILFQKTLSNGDIVKDANGYHFAIMPEDTEELQYKEYVFDIEICNENPFIKQTIVGKLKLTDEVTHKKDEG